MAVKDLAPSLEHHHQVAVDVNEFKVAISLLLVHVLENAAIRLFFNKVSKRQVCESHHLFHCPNLNL